jgi:hypothetical protein
MNDKEIHEYPILVPHSSYGDPQCPGIILAFRNGEYVDLDRNPGTADVDLMCNECGTIIRTVPVAKAEATLDKMSIDLLRDQNKQLIKLVAELKAENRRLKEKLED